MYDDLMRKAISQARSSKPHPNPRVGAIVLDPQGETVSVASHLGPGTAHAEELALSLAGRQARGGTLIATLEPCNHIGRTPPCVDSILDSGVSRVVVGVLDPDVRVSGAGVARLTESGVEVIMWDRPAEAEMLDPGYFVHRRFGRPRVTLKLAATLDGQSAAVDGSSRWITAEAARADGHLLRADADAVMVGAGTVLADDPRLTARTDRFAGPQPRPVVVAGGRQLDPGAAIFLRDPLVLATGPLDLPGEVLVVPDATGTRVDLVAGLAILAERGIVDVLVEGGPQLSGSLWSDGLVDAVVIYFGAKMAGGTGLGMVGGVFSTLSEATDVKIEDVVVLGDDLKVVATPLREAS